MTARFRCSQIGPDPLNMEPRMEPRGAAVDVAAQGTERRARRGPAKIHVPDAGRHELTSSHRYARPRGRTASTSITRSLSWRPKITRQSPTRRRHRRRSPRRRIASGQCADCDGDPLAGSTVEPAQRLECGRADLDPPTAGLTQPEAPTLPPTTARQPHSTRRARPPRPVR